MRTLLLLLPALLLMTMAALAMLLVQAVTLFRARRFCAERIGKVLGYAVLALAGVRLVVHQDRPFPESQTIYVANHSSTLDLFVLMALALPNTRFFMKRKYLLFGPLGLLAALTGTFFTPPQSMPEARRQLFEKAEKTLRRTRESAFLSPEGTRVTTGEIGPFNKGAFHLAMSLRAPIAPLFIEIPRDIDPGKGIRVLPGTVQVHVMEPVATASWRIEDLERNRDALRDRFVSRLERTRS